MVYDVNQLALTTSEVFWHNKSYFKWLFLICSGNTGILVRVDAKVESTYATVLVFKYENLFSKSCTYLGILLFVDFAKFVFPLERCLFLKYQLLYVMSSASFHPMFCHMIVRLPLIHSHNAAKYEKACRRAGEIRYVKMAYVIACYTVLSS